MDSAHFRLSDHYTQDLPEAGVNYCITYPAGNLRTMCSVLRSEGVSMSGMSGWDFLLLGGLLEVAWAISIKARPWWTLYLGIGAGAASVSCLYAALETMPIGTPTLSGPGLALLG